MELATVRFSGGPKDGIIETVKEALLYYEVHRKELTYHPPNKAAVIDIGVGVYKYDGRGTYRWQGWK